MDTENIKNFVSKISFFKVFSDHELSKLTGDGNTFKQFEKGSDIFVQGDPGSSLYVLLFGTVELIKLCDAEDSDKHVSLKAEKEQTVGKLDPGAVFGEISMLTGRKRSVTARIVSDKSVVMEINAKVVDNLIPSIQTKFHKQLLMALVQDLDDMDTRYIKLQSSIENSEK